MIEYALRRILYGVVVIAIVTILVFVVLRFLPGNAVSMQLQDAGGVSAEQAEKMMQEFGFDQPVLVQLGSWILGAVQGDFGTSFYTKQPVLEMFVERVPVTLQLAVLSLVVGASLGILFGALAAWRHGRLLDAVMRLLAIVSLSVPSFVLAILFLAFASSTFAWAPPIVQRGMFEDFWGWLQLVGLPAIALGAIGFGGMARMTRTSMLETASADYVRTARAKGVPERVVFRKHMLRSSSIVLLTLVGQTLGTILGGSVILEQMFGIRGTGLLVYDAVHGRDYPVVVVCTIFYATIYVAVVILVDLLYAVLDPRIRYGRS